MKFLLYVNAMKYVIFVGLVFAVFATDASEYFLKLKGTPVQGALIVAQTNPEAEVSIDNIPMAMTEDGHFIFGFGRFDDKDKVVSIQHQGHSYKTTVAVQARDFPTERIDGLPANKVNPPAERLARIAKEGAQVKAARGVWSEQKAFLESFVWPAEGRFESHCTCQRCGYHVGQ